MENVFTQPLTFTYRRYFPPSSSTTHPVAVSCRVTRTRLLENDKWLESFKIYRFDFWDWAFLFYLICFNQIPSSWRSMMGKNDLLQLFPLNICEPTGSSTRNGMIQVSRKTYSKRHGKVRLGLENFYPGESSNDWRVHRNCAWRREAGARSLLAAAKLELSHWFLISD